MKKYTIVVAGGKGLRMGSDIPKQFLPLNGRPVLMQTLEKFYTADPQMQLILVLPKNQIQYWKTLCEKHQFTLKHQIAEGGITRFHSVNSGLSLVERNSIVGIHDAVRPLVSIKTIQNTFDTAKKQGNAIPVVPIHDSVRMVAGDSNKHVDRSAYFIVQTPQVFLSNVILDAFKQEYNELFTDDASVAEAAGNKIHLTEGNFENIKLTRPIDFSIAEVLSKNLD